jgi:ankyrin repeat protein
MARKKAAAVKAPPRPKDAYSQLLYDMWRDPGVLQGHLDAGHGIDTLNAEGETLLHRACCADLKVLTKGSDTLVKQLLQAGADPNARFREGLTPLMLTRSPDLANCLLDHGADIERETAYGSSALELACGGGDLPVAKILLKRGAVEQILKSSKSGDKPLEAAASNKHEDVTLLLLQHLVLQPGFDINDVRLAGDQPLLCCAALEGLCRVAEFALDHGADVDVMSADGPPLILAVEQQQVSMVNLLCDRRANVQACFGAVNSLDVAVSVGNAKIVRSLIRRGADVNVVNDSKHSTALVQAAMLGHCEIVHLLLDAGAAVDEEKQIMVAFACCDSLDDAAAAELLKLLLSHCSSFAEDDYELESSLLARAVCKGKLQSAQLLHAAGGDVHFSAEHGTLMHYAAPSGNTAVVKWLQSLGLDPRVASGKRQMLPLHWACQHDHVLSARSCAVSTIMCS